MGCLLYATIQASLLACFFLSAKLGRVSSGGAKTEDIKPPLRRLACVALYRQRTALMELNHAYAT